MVTYELRIGSRAQVMHGTAKMTGGGFVPIPYHYYPQLGYQKFN